MVALIRLPLMLCLLTISACNRPEPRYINCPPPVAVPKGIPRQHTMRQVAELEVNVEYAREKERERANRCAAAVEWLLNRDVNPDE